MKRTEQDLLRVSDAAAYWVLRLEQEDSPQIRADFDRWLRRGGPAHVQEFWIAQLLWRNFNRIDASFKCGTRDSRRTVVEFPGPRDGEDGRGDSCKPGADLLAAGLRPSSPQGGEHLSEDSHPNDVSPVDPKRASTLRSSRVWFRWSLGIAASFLIALSVLLLVSGPFGSRVYATSVGSQQSINLEDGSVLQLNTHSKVLVHFSEKKREIRLLSGEAFFAVAHDASRPFVVVTDTARVRAVGTQFNVYLAAADSTRVSVVEGVVQVTTAVQHEDAGAAATGEGMPATAPGGAGKSRGVAAPSEDTLSRGSTQTMETAVKLGAGDEAVVHTNGISRSQAPDVRRAIAWQDRRLVFAGDRIDFIAEQFNRYNDLKIRVEGTIAERRMGGTFYVDDPMPLVRYLERIPDVEVIKRKSEIVIRPRQAGDVVQR